MNDLISRLSSRKLWMALFGIAYGIKYNMPDVVQWSIGLYLGAEGIGDAAGRLGVKKNTIINSPNSTASSTPVATDGDEDDDDDLDNPRTIVPGNTITPSK